MKNGCPCALKFAMLRFFFLLLVFAPAFGAAVCAAPPSVSTFSPDHGYAAENGAPGTIVTLSGMNFTDATAVKFSNGLSAGPQVADIHAAAAGFQIDSDSQIRAIVPLNSVTGKIGVANASGSSFGTDVFAVAPRVSTFSPVMGAVGSLVTLNGQNFGAVTAVQFNGLSAGPLVSDISAAAGYQIDSSKQIRVRVPPGATTGKISATDSFGDSGQSATDFKVLPTISAFAPVHGYARVTAKPGTPATPGTVVTITGSSFSGATAVKFNALSVGPPVADIADPKVIAGYHIVDDSHVKAIVPLYATTGKISVTNAGGSVLSAANFTVAPRMGSINPAGGTVGIVAALNGFNLGDVTSVRFNGKPKRR